MSRHCTTCREEGKCSRCGSYNRLRQLADVVLPEASRLTGRKLRVGSQPAAAGTACHHSRVMWRGLVPQGGALQYAPLLAR